jgi:hypothetical protein
MEPEKEVSFLKLIRELNREKVRYLVIGRRAVILYGGPVLTGDTDLWIHPKDKRRALSLVEDKFGLELSDSPDTKKPIVSGFSGMRKFDFFFQKSVKTFEDQVIHFEDCYKNSILKKDPGEDVHFRIPSIDDLIHLKKVRKPNIKDEQDIEYLLKARQLLRNSAKK